MLFSDYPRTCYPNSQLREVICQLRYPAILAVSGQSPAAFQEEIREGFPQYGVRQENPPPAPNGPRQPFPNHSFLSQDGLWKVNVTQYYFAFSTLAYEGWEDFARRLDQPLAAFIRLYRPASFLRLGLRYVNIISRERLGLMDRLWPELLTSPYAAVFQESDVEEGRVLASSNELVLRLDSSCQARVRSGLVRPRQQPGASQDPETRFLLDIDLSMQGSLDCSLAPGGLETLHRHSTPIFQGALTPVLRAALEG